MPSFSCSLDKSPFAQMICHDDELAKADSDVFGLFNAWSSNVKGPEVAARYRAPEEWIRLRDERCKANSIASNASAEILASVKACLLQEYHARAEFYEGEGDR